MAQKVITAEIDGVQHKITADIPDGASPEDIEGAVRSYMAEKKQEFQSRASRGLKGSPQSSDPSLEMPSKDEGFGESLKNTLLGIPRTVGNLISDPVGTAKRLPASAAMGMMAPVLQMEHQNPETGDWEPNVGGALGSAAGLGALRALQMAAESPKVRAVAKGAGKGSIESLRQQGSWHGLPVPGTVASSATGALVGRAFGGPGGAVIGATAGAVAPAIGGAIKGGKAALTEYNRANLPPLIPGNPQWRSAGVQPTPSAPPQMAAPPIEPPSLPSGRIPGRPMPPITNPPRIPMWKQKTPSASPARKVSSLSFPASRLEEFAQANDLTPEVARVQLENEGYSLT